MHFTEKFLGLNPLIRLKSHLNVKHTYSNSKNTPLYLISKERAIANGRRSFVSFLLLQLSNSFFRILAVPNKAVFCNSPVLMVIPSLSSHASNLLLITPSARTTTGTTSRCLIPHNLPISLFRSWHF